jgi:hypothetical protein
MFVKVDTLRNEPQRRRRRKSDDFFSLRFPSFDFFAVVLCVKSDKGYCVYRAFPKTRGAQGIVGAWGLRSNPQGPRKRRNPRKARFTAQGFAEQIPEP